MYSEVPRSYRNIMWRAAAIEALIFATLVFGFMDGILPLASDDKVFSWSGLLGSVAAGTVMWFALAQAFYRPTGWELPATNRPWLEQQIAYLRLQPARRDLSVDGRAYQAPMSFHFTAELWVRPMDGDRLRVDGPRQLIKKLQKRYVKRTAI